MGAAGVMDGTAPLRGAGRGSNPTAALHAIQVLPVPFIVARELIERHHYLHSMPGGTKLTFGVLADGRLLGAVTLGAGPHMVYSLVDGARPDDCLTLTRFWLSDELPRNSESRVIGIVLRALRRFTHVRFLVSYADPSRGHTGVIYQASGWLYTGLSEAMPRYDIGDGRIRHSRSLSHAYGTHSVKYFASCGVSIRIVKQAPKHRYMYFLDRSWEARLKIPVLPYPGKEY